MGLPRIPLPHVDERPAKGRLRLLSPASAWAMNTSYANDAKNRDKMAEEGVVLHPDDAAARGLSEGALVRLVQRAGRDRHARRMSPQRTPQGVALAVKGAWPKLRPSSATSTRSMPPQDRYGREHLGPWLLR